MPRLPQSPIQRQSTLNRTMVRNAAGGRSALVAPEPRPLAPLGTLARVSSGGATGAAFLGSNLLQTIPSGTTTALTAACFDVNSTVSMSDVTAIDGGSLQIHTATGRIEVVTAGTFLIGAEIEWTGTGGTYRSIEIQRDGVAPSSSPLVARDKVAAVAGACQSCIGIATGGPGDTFFVLATHDNGTTADVGGGGTSFFWAVGLGSYGSAI